MPYKYFYLGKETSSGWGWDVIYSVKNLRALDSTGLSCAVMAKGEFITLLCLRNWSSSEPLRETHDAVWMSGVT